ncbi:MAG: LacI family DNA-binding transcriptional regulator [Rhodobacteraceae bacterium]|nr:LacI family DNA-binding transcriptional regulator [Paracoccaceae bacterium]
MAKPTYLDIAALAGVGTATVERVLNGRGGVTDKTSEKVVQAARMLDWPGRLPERHRGITRIEVILVRPETPFFQRLARAFRRIAASLDPSIHVHVTFLDENDPKSIAARIGNPPAPRSALAIAAPDHPDIRREVDAQIGAGLPVVQIVSRTATGAEFVGIDNTAAGRMAGLMMSRLAQSDGTVLAICHSQVYRGHRDRIRGFSDYVTRHPNPGLTFDLVRFGGDSSEANAQIIERALRGPEKLVAVYNAGGGNAGIFDALRLARRKVFFVGHELDEASAEALRDGVADVILDQLPEAQARRTLDILLWRNGLVPERIDNPPIRFTTITAENL